MLSLGRKSKGACSAAAIARESRLVGPGLPKAVMWTDIAVDRGEGAILYDIDGNSYLDFMGAGGVNSIGHAHPAVAEAVHEQLQQFTVGSFTSSARIALLERMTTFLPRRFDSIQFYSGGTEAVEAALRLAKSATGHGEFLSFWGGFHGKTLGSASLTTNGRDAVTPLPGGFFSAPYASASGGRFGLSARDYASLCSSLVEEVIRQNCSNRLAAIVIEPIQGRSGNIVPDPGFMTEVAELARRHGALLISDESMTGFGRTGREFGYLHYNEFEPDILILGKGLGAGYPITALAASRDLMGSGSFGDPSASSSSFGGFPVACAAAEATLGVIEADKLVDAAADLGACALARLREALVGCPIVADVRGLGLALAVELKGGHLTDGSDMTETVFRRLVERGLLVMLGGSTLRLYPPLNVSPTEVDSALSILSGVLGELELLGFTLAIAQISRYQLPLVCSRHYLSGTPPSLDSEAGCPNYPCIDLR